ncbi:MAG: 50S ribosomal protein L19e [Aigarchaeota archaeon]|nr:50S ribosomal protein L19e [Aigarchaeota archaeon]
MHLRLQKRTAASLLKCGVNKVRFDPERMDDIEAAMTRDDTRSLISDGAIYRIRDKGISRSRVKRKRRRKGEGSKKGGAHSKISRKRRWMSKVRPQRKELARLRDGKLLEPGSYRKMYRLVKASNFRSVANLREYLKENKLLRRGLS